MSVRSVPASRLLDAAVHAYLINGDYVTSAKYIESESGEVIAVRRPNKNIAQEFLDANAQPSHPDHQSTREHLDALYGTMVFRSLADKVGSYEVNLMKLMDSTGDILISQHIGLACSAVQAAVRDKRQREFDLIQSEALAERWGIEGRRGQITIQVMRVAKSVTYNCNFITGVTSTGHIVRFADPSCSFEWGDTVFGRATSREYDEDTKTTKLGRPQLAKLEFD